MRRGGHGRVEPLVVVDVGRPVGAHDQGRHRLGRAGQVGEARPTSGRGAASVASGCGGRPAARRRRRPGACRRSARSRGRAAPTPGAGTRRSRPRRCRPPPAAAAAGVRASPSRPFWSWSRARSPISSHVGAPSRATPVAVDRTPSMPLAPRLASTRRPARRGPYHSRSRTGIEDDTTSASPAARPRAERPGPRPVRWRRVRGRAAVEGRAPRRRRPPARRPSHAGCRLEPAAPGRLPPAPGRRAQAPRRARPPSTCRQQRRPGRSGSSTRARPGRPATWPPPRPASHWPSDLGGRRIAHRRPRPRAGARSARPRSGGAGRRHGPPPSGGPAGNRSGDRPGSASPATRPGPAAQRDRHAPARPRTGPVAPTSRRPARATSAGSSRRSTGQPAVPRRAVRPAGGQRARRPDQRLPERQVEVDGSRAGPGGLEHARLASERQVRRPGRRSGQAGIGEEAHGRAVEPGLVDRLRARRPVAARAAGRRCTRAAAPRPGGPRSTAAAAPPPPCRWSSRPAAGRPLARPRPRATKPAERSSSTTWERSRGVSGEGQGQRRVAGAGGDHGVGHPGPHPFVDQRGAERCGFEVSR